LLELNDKVRRDSAYSSNQERINVPQSIYEPLSECYSGYSFIQSDFLTPNISSIQSTTDEAYESEPTTMCSSIATTTHVHPYLEHEFEYPSPPPPVPDRRLKPAHLKLSPPPTKPRLTKQDNLDSAGYSIIQKSKPLAISSIQQFLTSTSNDSTSFSTRTMSSRHYCGSIPVSNEVTESSVNSTPIKPNEQSKDKTKEKRNSRTLNCLHPSTTDDDHKRNPITKSSSSSLNKTKIKKQKLITDFDEATNGLAIRLPAPISNGYDITHKQNSNKFDTKTSIPVSIKRANIMTKNRQIPDNVCDFFCFIFIKISFLFLLIRSNRIEHHFMKHQFRHEISLLYSSCNSGNMIYCSLVINPVSILFCRWFFFSMIFFFVECAFSFFYDIQ